MARGAYRGKSYGTHKSMFDKKAVFDMWEPGALTLPISQRGSIRVDPDINKTVAEFIKRLAPTVARAFNDHFLPYAREEYNNWPHYSGKSKSMLDVEYNIKGGGAELSCSFVSRAEYTRWIWRGQLVRELYDYGKKAADKIADQLAEGLI